MKDQHSVALSPTDQNTTKEALKHFTTAFAFLILGILTLVWNSERLSQGAFADSRVLGGLHFITLGWLSISIFGALRVFTGVALGSQGFGISLVSWIRRLWTTGTVLFPTGLILQIPLFIILGVSLIGTALLLFTIHIVPALFQSQRGELTQRYLIIALLSLWGTWLLGALAAFVRAGNPITELPAGYFHAHILFAVFGWAGATIVGVGSHLLPMFALSHEPSNLPVKAALPIWSTIPIFATIGVFYSDPFIKIGWIAAGVGSLLWATQVGIYFKTRLRKENDPGLYLAAGATLLLGIAWVVGAMTHAPITFIGLIVIGWLALFTLGIYHRVIPFLIWFDRFSKNAGRGPVPKVKDLINEKLAMTTALSTLIGSLTWGIGLFLQKVSFVYFGSTLILLGCSLTLGQLKTLFGEIRIKKIPSKIIMKGRL